MNKAASRNVASRLLLTAGRQAGSSGSPSARAEASTRASSGSPPSALRLPAVLTAALAVALAAVLAAVLAGAFLVAVARDVCARDAFTRKVFAREVLGFLSDSDLARFVAIAIVVSDPVEGPLCEGRVRDGGQKVASILRFRRKKHLLGQPLLDDLSRLHDDDTVAEEPHHVEIVRDEEVAHPHGILELLQQIEHHRLHRHVERGGRLVENDQIWVERDRPRDAD